MVPTRNGVLALLGLAISIRAAPAGLQQRQIGINPPKQSVSWEMGNPKPTEEPQEPVLPSKPVDTFSLGTPSGWISWETGGPGPADAPEEPDYPPPVKPTDQFSIGNPSFSITWDGDGPGASSMPKPEPTLAPEPTPPSEPTSTPKPPSTPTLAPCPPPKPTITKSNSISPSPPNFSATWGLKQRSAKPTWTKEERETTKTMKSSSTSTPTSTPTPTPIPLPSPIPISTPTPIPLPSPIPIPTPTPTPSPSPSTSSPTPTSTPPAKISLGPPGFSITWDKNSDEPPPHTGTVIWDKRSREANAAPDPTTAAPMPHSMGLEFSRQSITWPQPSPPTYISWAKRHGEAGPPPAWLGKPSATVVWGGGDRGGNTLETVYVAAEPTG